MLGRLLLAMSCNAAILLFTELLVEPLLVHRISLAVLRQRLWLSPTRMFQAPGAPEIPAHLLSAALR
jgi:hypothetical protein